MLLSSINEFSLVIPSVAAGTRPATAWGSAVTPAQNAYGAYVQLLSGASVTDDCYEIEVEVNNVGQSTLARDCIVTIGFDPAGGTSYTDTIIDLVCGPAAQHFADNTASVCGGVYYRFPLFVKSGTSIAAKASVNSATLSAIRVACRLFARPSRPDLIRVGSFVTTFGSSPSTSAGTAITPGTTSEGAWTQIGSALTTPLWYWETGYGINSGTMSLNGLNVDIGLGDASNKRVVIQDALFSTDSFEKIAKDRIVGRYARGAVGDLVYARSQCGPGAADAANSVAVYGVGG